MAKTVEKTQKKTVKKDNKKVNTKKNVKEEKKNTKKIVIENVEATEKVKEPVKEVKKEKKVKVKKNNKNWIEFLEKVDNNRYVIIMFIVGFLIATLLFRCIFWPDRIATLKDGTQPIASLNDKTITADDLYTSMKEYYSVNVLLNDIDKMVLTKLYPDNDEINTEVKKTAEYYYSTYEQNYGYTKETFLSQYGFADESAFMDSLKLDYRRNKYYDEYAEKLVTEDEINKYYKDEVFGDVDSKHILVAISEDGLKDSEAKKLAEEIITKLNKGTTWDEIITEYGDKITHEELGYNAFNASLESAYLKECKDLEVNTYSKTPVLTSYGYHIVYKNAQKDKPKLEDVKDDVIDALAKNKKSNDSNLYYKALVAMREEAGLTFVDTKLSDEYKDYLAKYK